MALTKIIECTKFNLEEIKKNTLVRAKHTSWSEPRNGIIEKATEDVLIVLFLTEYHSATCYFNVLASEVMEGEWSILFTNDMTEVSQLVAIPASQSSCNCDDNASKEDIDDIFDKSEGGTDE